jgi:mannose-6-phosphate isomerase-like protein (cupin superfamily)
MSTLEAKQFTAPDEVRPFTAHGHIDMVVLTTGPVGLGTFEPGWKWSRDIKPVAGTQSCQVSHTGYCLSGRMAVLMDDGTLTNIEPGDVVHIPAGHDAWTLGDAPCMFIDFGGLRGYAITEQAGR